MRRVRSLLWLRVHAVSRGKAVVGMGARSVCIEQSNCMDRRQFIGGNPTSKSFAFTKGWTRKTFGAVGFRWILVHIFCTLALLGEKLYPKMFNDQQLNTTGWVAIAFGIAAFVCFSLPWYRDWETDRKSVV